MDNLIQKLYNKEKEDEQKYSQFGALSHRLPKNSKSNLNFDTSGLARLNIGTINPSFHSPEENTQITKTPRISQETFLSPKNLVFNSARDLFNIGNNHSRNYFPNYNKENKHLNTINISQNKIPSLQEIKQNINLETKKNSTKIQMMEEKMKNLELKNQRLEVINDFFFDMFENNLVKEELKKQKEIKRNEELNEYKENKDNREDELDDEEKRRRKKNKKHKNRNLFKIDMSSKKKKELEIENFKKKTKDFARNYLNDVKNHLGIFLVDDQLVKNEKLHDLAEDIIDLKGDLLNKLEKMDMNQNKQMQKIAFCLQNSGDEKIEYLANRVFGEYLPKNIESTGPNSFNSTRNKQRGSVFMPRGSLFNTIVNSRKQSVSSITDDNNNNIKRQSFIDKDENNIKSKRESLSQKVIGRKSLLGQLKQNNISRRSSFFGKENQIRRKSLLGKEKNIIIEESHENDG